MTCVGCINASPDAADIRRARAIICHWCLYAEHEPDGTITGTAVACTVDGLSVDSHVTSCRPSCPKGKHPDENGMVVFMGIRWYGVPAFLRWLLVFRLTGAVPGCGCVAYLKDLWLRAKARMAVRTNKESADGPISHR